MEWTNGKSYNIRKIVPKEKGGIIMCHTKEIHT